MIRITCPCGQELQTPDEHAGKKARCPKCQSILSVPGGREGAFVPAPQVEGVRRGRGPELPAARPVQDDYDYERDERRPMPRRRREPGQTSGKALSAFLFGLAVIIAAAVLGLLAPMWTIAFPAALGLFTLVLGLLAIRDVHRSEGRLTGFGLALAGLLVGSLGAVAYFPGYLVQASRKRVNEEAARMQETNNLRQIVLGLHAYHDVHKAFPNPGNVDPATGKPLLSWRVHILPYLGEDVLFREFRLNEPWDSPHNMKLASRMPAVFRSTKPTPPDHTTYQFLVGPGTMFRDWPPKLRGPLPRGPRIATIVDGTSNTLLVVESTNPVPWTKPEDITLDPARPTPSLGYSMPDRFLAAFADGSVSSMRKGIRPDLLRDLIDPMDGRPIPIEELDEVRGPR